MNTTSQIWIGRIITGLVGSLLLLDASVKLAELAPAIEGTVRLGYPARLVFVLGVIELLSVATYLIRRTAFIGAILLTAYFGGAVATHLRIEDPLWTHTFSSVYVGILTWTGLLLRDVRLRTSVRFSRAAAEPALNESRTVQSRPETVAVR